MCSRNSLSASSRSVYFGDVDPLHLHHHIGGLTGLIAPTAVPAEIVWFDGGVMVIASFALLAFAWTGRPITRLEGSAFLAFYAIYLYLVVSG